MRKFGRLAQRLFNTPLMLRPEKAEMLCAALVDRLGIAKLDRLDGTSIDAAQLRLKADDWGAEYTPKTARDMYTIDRGVATLSIDGTLVHKLGGVEPSSGMVGYDCIDKILTDIRANDDAKVVAVDNDSPGGETAGCFELAKKIYANSARFGGKPIYAIVNEMSCSADYALACACDRIAGPETLVAGSIGVWTMIVDFTKALDKDGIAPFIIRAGDRKARGGPYEAPDQATVDKLQAWVDETWRMFANLVSKCRNIPVEKILDQQGDWYPGDEAVKLGLVDVIASPDEIFEVLRAEAARR
ncbi:MAG TPA: S49 family peptidase [Allosphingosinicella sp.]|nr:S49 family peptidase [Allosphingosinicella sp.]